MPRRPYAGDHRQQCRHSICTLRTCSAPRGPAQRRERSESGTGSSSGAVRQHANRSDAEMLDDMPPVDMKSGPPAIELPADKEMVMPGDNVSITVKLINPIAMEEGLRFAIREGGRTVGAGVVTKITE